MNPLTLIFYALLYAPITYTVWVIVDGFWTRIVLKRHKKG